MSNPPNDRKLSAALALPLLGAAALAIYLVLLGNWRDAAAPETLEPAGTAGESMTQLEE